MHQLSSYLKFLWQSKNQHGVHSPFVYKLVTECFYDQTPYEDYKALDAYRKALKHSKTVLKVMDLGAGSKRLKTSKRRVASMVNIAGSSRTKAYLLYRICNHMHCTNGLELGTSLGIGSYALALGHRDGQLTSIEGCTNTSHFAKTQLTERGITNIHFLVGNFTDVIPSLPATNYDLVFFDGHHQKQATLNYFESLLPKAHNDSVFIFDDIYWSKGMTEAWETIKTHPKVKVTVDTFHLGLVFFRSEQAKEHFKIRL